MRNNNNYDDRILIYFNCEKVSNSKKNRNDGELRSRTQRRGDSNRHPHPNRRRESRQGEAKEVTHFQ